MISRKFFPIVIVTLCLLLSNNVICDEIIERRDNFKDPTVKRFCFVPLFVQNLRGVGKEDTQEVLGRKNETPEGREGQETVPSMGGRNLATMKSNSNPSGTGWVGLQAITAFFVIIAAVAFALFLRPISVNRSQYQPV